MADEGASKNIQKLQNFTYMCLRTKVESRTKENLEEVTE
jgi:hypothetical protein